MANKPFGKQPFSWKHDPEYQEEKIEKLEKLHQKILKEQLAVQRDKYGNIVRKQIDIDREVPQDLIESKKKRFENIIRKNIYGDSEEEEDYNVQQEVILNPLRNCGKNVIVTGTYPANIAKPQLPKPSSVSQKAPNRTPSSTKTQPKSIVNRNNSQKVQTQGNKSKCSEFHFQRYGGVSGPDSALIDMLEREVVDNSPEVKLDDIADLEAAKNLLQEAVLLPLMIPNYFQGIRRPWKGVLMFGPPGTGKTMLAKAIASTGKTKFFNISASSFASKWRGESEKLVRVSIYFNISSKLMRTQLLFEMARFYAPSTVFIDQIDSVASKRTSQDDEASRRVKTELLVQMDGIGSNSDKPVIIIAATNRPWDLDEALRRRLEKRIYVPLPNLKGRKQLFEANTKSIKLDKSVDFEILAKKTDGFSGADLVILIRSASFLPMRRYFAKKGGIQNANLDDCQKQVDIPLTQSDFLQALKACNPSVGTQDLGKYQSWMKEFGSI